MELLFDNRQNEIVIDDEVYDLLKKVVLECLHLENRGDNYEISISFVNDNEIKELNKIYRGKDMSTDVLSFPMEDDEELDGPYKPLLGDIVISLETASKQAKYLGHSLEREIAYLTAHSMFHLMGYDHMEEDDKRIMRENEKEVMRSLGIFK